MRLDHYLVFCGLAALVGYFANRTSMCTVKAVAEIITTRRAYMLASFGKTIVWVVGITLWIRWWRTEPPAMAHSYQIVWTGILGGALFGVGATLNGGCAISTLTRLGNGNLGMLVTLIGFAGGVVIAGLASLQLGGFAYESAQPLVDAGKYSALLLGVAVTTWMIWEFVRLLRTANTLQWRDFLVSRQLRLSTAAAMIGICNGILYSNLGTWSYTYTLRRSISEHIINVGNSVEPVSMNMLWWLLLALLAGVLIASIVGGRFVLAWQPKLGWLGYFAGGILMGLGTALAPGGNDVLLLNAIPGMSPHAVPAYMAMLVGIWMTLAIVKWHHGQLEPIDCGGDICRVNTGTDSMHGVTKPG